VYKGNNLPKVFIINLNENEYFYENNDYCMTISGNIENILEQILNFGKIDYTTFIQNKFNKYII
jgi:hypothetical protein